MEKIEAYRCQHCGKLYLTSKGCQEHEDHLCTKHPERRPYCYNCQHYSPSYSSDNREEVMYYTIIGYNEQGLPNFKKIDLNKCRKYRCKLYNNIRLSNELQEALSDHGYKPMPTPQTGGCKHFTTKH